MKRLNVLCIALAAFLGRPAMGAMSNAGMSAAICAQLGTAKDATKQTAFCDQLAAGIVAYIQANAKCTLPASSVVTTGSAATQTGPAAPVVMAVQ